MNVKLRVVQGRPQGKSILFPLGEYVFGRGAECHIQPNSDWVSRQHCLLRVTDRGLFVRDLGSRNGTLVNGSLVTSEVQLKTGDQLQVGPLVLEVRLEEGPEERTAFLPEQDADVQRKTEAEDTQVVLNETAQIEDGAKQPADDLAETRQFDATSDVPPFPGT